MADKPDSHDIIPSGDTRAFLGARIGVRPGAVVDASSGERLAEHDGVHGFTIGQRKGLGIEAPAADGKPRYVTDIDPESGTVTVGTAADLQVWGITATRAVWTSGETPDAPFEAVVQVRAHGGLTPVTATPTTVDGEPAIDIVLHEPLTGVAKGQAAVLYLPDAERGDQVVGCGRIAATSSQPTVAAAR